MRKENTNFNLNNRIKYIVAENGNTKLVTAVLTIDHDYNAAFMREVFDRIEASLGVDYWAWENSLDDVLRLPTSIKSTVRWDNTEEFDAERYKENARQSVLNKFYRTKCRRISALWREIDRKLTAAFDPVLIKNETIIKKHPFKWIDAEMWANMKH